MNWSLSPSLWGFSKRKTHLILQPSGSIPLIVAPQPKPNPGKVQVSRDNKGKGVASKPNNLNSQNKCFECQGLDHVAAECANKAFIIDGEQEGDEDDLGEQIYEPKLDEFHDIDEECIQVVLIQEEYPKSSLDTPRWM